MNIVRVQTTETDRALRDAIAIIAGKRKAVGWLREQNAARTILMNAQTYLASQLSMEGFVQEISGGVR
jgi:hypothetical protein